MIKLKTIFKFIFALILLAILALAIFAAFNWTLIKNMRAQERTVDAYAIETMQPRQVVLGGQSKALAAPIANDSFVAALENWEASGGKALLVWHKGELVLETYAKGISPEARSKSFSLHKSVLGLVAAAMEADGIIDLDDPLSLYIDKFKNDPRGKLSIRDMLTHQSGLERYPVAPPSYMGLQLLLSDKIERAALKAKIADDTPVFDYSNLGYQVAGAALRKALSEKTSLTYAQYLSENIWQKIGANEAHLWSETKDGAPRFYSGLIAAPKDWLKLGIAIAENNGSVVPQSAIETFLAPSEKNPNYGLGIWRGMPADLKRKYGPSTAFTVNSDAPFTLSDMVYMDGFGGQRVYISQSEQLVIVRIGDVRFDWQDTALPNLITQALEIEPAATAQSIVTLTAENGRKVKLHVLTPHPPVANPKLVLFSHGAFSAPSRYDALLKPMAAAGLHIASPLHIDSELYPDNSAYSPNDWEALRLEDMKLAAAYFADKPIAENGWISAGHSFGSKIALIYGGAGLEPEANITALGKASHILAVSPPGDLPHGFPPEAAANITSPTLIITGDEDLVPGMISNWKDHLFLHHKMPEGLSTAAIFDSQDHYFNGLYGRPKPRKASQADNELLALIAAFTQNKELPEGQSYSLLK